MKFRRLPYWNALFLQMETKKVSRGPKISQTNKDSTNDNWNLHQNIWDVALLIHLKTSQCLKEVEAGLTLHMLRHFNVNAR